jgi:hypothetical protein
MILSIQSTIKPHSFEYLYYLSVGVAKKQRRRNSLRSQLLEETEK